jgi:hypothetical protein
MKKRHVKLNSKRIVSHPIFALEVSRQRAKYGNLPIEQLREKARKAILRRQYRNK